MYFACLLLIRKSDWKTYFKLLRPGDSDFLCSLGNYSSKIFERCPTVRVEKSGDYGKLAPGTPKTQGIPQKYIRQEPISKCSKQGSLPFQSIHSVLMAPFIILIFIPVILYYNTGEII